MHLSSSAFKLIMVRTILALGYGYWPILAGIGLDWVLGDIFGL